MSSIHESRLRHYVYKMKGDTVSLNTPTIRESLISGLGGFLAIGILGCLTVLFEFPWLMAPFGASCVLAFSAHKGPFSQPRAIIGGHMVSTLIGLVVLQLFGDTWWSIALAVFLAIVGMMLTRTIHPPAGADPIVVIMGNSGWLILIHPVLLGSITLVVIALLYNNLFRERQYPQYWW